MRILLFLLCILEANVFATVPTIVALSETTPIPAGIESSDDPAIWLHPITPEKSLIVGVSKNKERDGGLPGIAIYDLQGKELQYVQHDRLNNVDLKYNFPYKGRLLDIVAASNRDKKAISLFEITENKLQFMIDLQMKDMEGVNVEEEPYGFCLSYSSSDRKRLYAFSPMKSGLIYQHLIVEKNGKLEAIPVRAIDTSLYLSREIDQHLIDITVKEVVYEENLPKGGLIAEITEEIRDRFQLEGCVADDESGYLYYGMENLGVWKIAFDPRSKAPAKLIVKVLKAKSEPNSHVFSDGVPRLANDIEGMALHYGPNGQGALIVSIQGLDEYAFFDRVTDEYLGSFSLTLSESDPITETDGLELLSTPMGAAFPMGMLVVHDHHNTDGSGNVINANYKIASLGDILAHFPKLKYENYVYDPRR